MAESDYDTEWAERVAALAESDLLKGQILVNARRVYDDAKDVGELERAKNALIAAIENGPSYRPVMVETPFDDAAINDVFNNPKTPHAWKTEMIAEVEAEHAAKYPVRLAVHKKQMLLVTRRRRTTGSIGVIIVGLAFLYDWHVGLIFGLVLFSLGCWATKFWTN